MKILYLILAADMAPFQQHMTAQKMTWASDLDENSAVWVFGSDRGEINYNAMTRNLVLPIPEIYDNILQKTILGMKWSLENVEYDFLIRGNTSTYYENSRLNELLRNIDPKSLYLGGKLGTYRIPSSDPEEVFTFISGACMILSRASVVALSEMNTQEFENWEDDPAISYYLGRKKGVKLTGIKRNDLTDFEPFSPSTSHRVKSWKNIDYPILRFNELFAIYQANGISRSRKIISHALSEIMRYRKEMPMLHGLNLLRFFRYLIKVLFSFRKSLYKE
jgi:hypothetical protein